MFLGIVDGNYSKKTGLFSFLHGVWPRFSIVSPFCFEMCLGVNQWKMAEREVPLKNSPLGFSVECGHPFGKEMTTEMHN